MPKIQRQISRSMSTAYAEARQQAYEERIQSRRLDSFISLHHLDHEDHDPNQPVYVSERIDKFMNPDFRSLMPQDIEDPSFLRGRTLLVRVWAKRNDKQNFSLLIEEKIVLPELQFVAEDLDFATAQFKDNTVLLHLPDGVYTSYASSTFEDHPGRPKTKAPAAKSATFDALMKLKKLVEVIDDAKITQQTIKSQIEGILADTTDHSTMLRSDGAHFVLRNIREARSRVERDIVKLKHDTKAREKAHKGRKAGFESARANLKQCGDTIRALQSEMSSIGQTHSNLKTSLKSHTARIAEDLLDIFPIEPLADAPSEASTPTSSRPSSASSHQRPFTPGFAFTIRELYLPHASNLAKTHPPKNEAEVSAALGYVGGIVMFLSRTLLVHVPFPIRVLGSQSVIRDDITPDRDLISNRLLLPSQTDLRGDEIANHTPAQDKPVRADADGARTFPLFARGVDPARFRWAVYLLNKDIEEMISKAGVRVVDVRDTLANLRLLLVALAGGNRDASLPKREMGRVAGLRSHHV